MWNKIKYIWSNQFCSTISNSNSKNTKTMKISESSAYLWLTNCFMLVWTFEVVSVILYILAHNKNLSSNQVYEIISKGKYMQNFCYQYFVFFSRWYCRMHAFSENNIKVHYIVGPNSCMWQIKTWSQVEVNFLSAGFSSMRKKKYWS